jgi:hypothetical protein
MGKAFRFLAAHEMARALGPEKAQALPMFHALTGCDTVSCFAGHGKRTAWAVWTALPALTQTLVDLSTAPIHVDEDHMHTIERFVILLYDRTSTSTDVNKARCKLPRRVMSSSYHRQVPPSSSTSDELCTRAGMSGGRLWFLHQHCPLQLTGGGSRPATRCTSPTGQRSLRHPKSARSLSPANARKVAQRSASARKQNWNVHHCVLAKDNVRITELLQELNLCYSE